LGRCPAEASQRLTNRRGESRRFASRSMP
jgi:hypothetical protein